MGAAAARWGPVVAIIFTRPLDILPIAETKDVSNSEYFGDPIYTYSLKRGIEDGFLAPYKVIRILLDKDVGGYRPAITDRDRQGNQIADKTYDSKDFDRKIVLTKRTEIVAKEITKFLKKTNRFNKTIVFCVDIEHAQRMTQALIAENADLVKQNRKYIMQITGDNNEGKQELDNFTDVEKTYPAIVTTSKLLTTGVDVQTCKLIVLDANIESKIEFKQIIGRGTRIREDFGKNHFTILDFRRATDQFSDPDFDGDPIKIKEINQEEEIDDEDFLNEENQNNDANFEEDLTSKYTTPSLENIEKNAIIEKIYVDNVEVKIIYKQTQFLDENQREIIQSKLANKITSEGVLQIISQVERSQLGNKKLVISKFKEWIESSFKVQKKRKETKVPFAVKEKRLLTKKRKAEIKKMRKVYF